MDTFNVRGVQSIDSKIKIELGLYEPLSIKEFNALLDRFRETLSIGISDKMNVIPGTCEVKHENIVEKYPKLIEEYIKNNKGPLDITLKVFFQLDAGSSFLADGYSISFCDEMKVSDVYLAFSSALRKSVLETFGSYHSVAQAPVDISDFKCQTDTVSMSAPENKVFCSEDPLAGLI